MYPILRSPAYTAVSLGTRFYATIGKQPDFKKQIHRAPLVRHVKFINYSSPARASKSRGSSISAGHERKPHQDRPDGLVSRKSTGVEREYSKPPRDAPHQPGGRDGDQNWQGPGGRTAVSNSRPLGKTAYKPDTKNLRNQEQQGPVREAPMSSTALLTAARYSLMRSDRKQGARSIPASLDKTFISKRMKMMLLEHRKVPARYSLGYDYPLTSRSEPLPEQSLPDWPVDAWLDSSKYARAWPGGHIPELDEVAGLRLSTNFRFEHRISGHFHGRNDAAIARHARLMKEFQGNIKRHLSKRRGEPLGNRVEAHILPQARHLLREVWQMRIFALETLACLLGSEQGEGGRRTTSPAKQLKVSRSRTLLSKIPRSKAEEELRRKLEAAIKTEEELARKVEAAIKTTKTAKQPNVPPTRAPSFISVIPDEMFKLNLNRWWDREGGSLLLVQQQTCSLAGRKPLDRTRPDADKALEDKALGESGIRWKWGRPVPLYRVEVLDKRSALLLKTGYQLERVKIRIALDRLMTGNKDLVKEYDEIVNAGRCGGKRWRRIPR